jgi:hypothetical protein
MRTLYEHTCKYCATVFHRERNGNRYDYCSKRCAFDARRRYDPQRLASLAHQGIKGGVIAVEFGLNRKYVKDVLIRHDLYRTWQMARYKKCQQAA